jgi:hypothetical protein
MCRGQKKSRLALSSQVAEKLPGDGRCSGEIKRSRFFRGVYERNVLETFQVFLPSVLVLFLCAHIFAQASRPRWTEQQAQEWYAAQPLPAGANFLTSTASNDLEMWKGDTFDGKAIDRELS